MVCRWGSFGGLVFCRFFVVDYGLVGIFGFVCLGDGLLGVFGLFCGLISCILFCRLRFGS